MQNIKTEMVLPNKAKMKLTEKGQNLKNYDLMM